MPSATLSYSILSLPARGLPPGPARIAIRPESLLIDGPAAGASLPGTVRKCTYLGNHQDIMVATERGELFVVRYGAHAMLAPGTAVMIGFAGSGVTLIPPA